MSAKPKPEPVVSQLEYPITIRLKMNAPMFTYLSKDGNLIEVQIRSDEHRDKIIEILRESFDLPD